jgi:hypothetical protein
MKSDNIVHLDQLRRHRRTKGVSHDSGGRLKRLTTAGQLCAALFAHLDASEPRVPVQATVAAWMRHLLQDLRGGQTIRTPPAFFTEILPDIYWNDVPPDAARCGLSLMLCAGSLSEAMHRYEVYNLPVSRAADIMLDFYEGRDLRFARRRGQWWVRSTPGYERRYGTVVRVPLPHRPLEHPLDLGNL